MNVKIGELCSYIVSADLVPDEHAELDDGVHLGLHDELGVLVQRAGGAEHRGRGGGEQRGRGGGRDVHHHHAPAHQH